MGTDPDDVAITVLCTLVRSALSEILEEEQGPGSMRLERLQRFGRYAMEDGMVPGAVRTLTIWRRPCLARYLAALSLLPGGVRICQIIFCADHSPGGTYAPHRLSCSKCSPDDIAARGYVHRDVVAIEGNL